MSGEWRMGSKKDKTTRMVVVGVLLPDGAARGRKSRFRGWVARCLLVARIDVVLLEGGVIDAGDDLPERLVLVVDPRAALSVGEVGVGVEIGPADEEGSVDEQEVIADVLGLGGDAREGFDQMPEEHGVGAEQRVGVVPDVEAELGGGSEAEGLAMAEQVDDAAGAVDAPFERGAGESSFQLVAEGLEVGDGSALERDDLGVAHRAEELAEGGAELGPFARVGRAGHEVVLVHELSDLSGAVRDGGERIGMSSERTHGIGWVRFESVRGRRIARSGRHTPHDDPNPLVLHSLCRRSVHQKPAVTSPYGPFCRKIRLCRNRLGLLVL